jgi:hypothetical protein
LVDVDHLVEVFEADEAVVGGGVLRRAVELSRHRLVERVDDERGFARAGDAGDAGEQAERDVGGDGFQVVAARARERQGAALVGLAALGRHRHRAFA